MLLLLLSASSFFFADADTAQFSKGSNGEANEPLVNVLNLAKMDVAAKSDAKEPLQSGNFRLALEAFKLLGATSPQVALNLVAALEHKDRTAALHSASAGAVFAHSEQLFIHAARQLDRGARLAAESSLLATWARVEPDRARVAFATLIPKSDRIAPVRDALGRAWVEIDPVEASLWWLATTPTTERSASIEQIVQVWAETDFEAAAGWLDSVDASPNVEDEKDYGIRALSLTLSDTDPERALRFAATIKNKFIQKEVRAEVCSGSLMETALWDDPIWERSKFYLTPPGHCS